MSRSFIAALLPTEAERIALLAPAQLDVTSSTLFTKLLGLIAGAQAAYLTWEITNGLTVAEALDKFSTELQAARSRLGQDVVKALERAGTDVETALGSLWGKL